MFVACALNFNPAHWESWGREKGKGGGEGSRVDSSLGVRGMKIGDAFYDYRYTIQS